MKSGGATPADHVEVIALVHLEQRDDYISAAIDALVAAGNVVAAAEEIVERFFGDLPRYTRDAPRPQQRGTAPAPVPGAFPIDGGAMRAGHDDWKRDPGELEVALRVLIGATLRCAELDEFAATSAKRIRKNVVFPLQRAGAKTAAAELDRLVTILARCSKAAGTGLDAMAVNMRQLAESRERAQMLAAKRPQRAQLVAEPDAMAHSLRILSTIEPTDIEQFASYPDDVLSDELEAAARFRREHVYLREHGHTHSRVSDYIENNLRRWRAERN